ncbi:MAG: NAD/FAD-binding protein [Alphaproteobacteria bacterium TMED87]|nr:NAD/FAD-binding protein [Rhodospirillaceae bacterium]OUV08091.1 MAG: NAD/FAD-binding protein [Alphaproteobacteria bacterium TMED87]
MAESAKKEIAVIGSGISGLSAAWLLAKKHKVTIFEKNDKFGGHSNTINIPMGKLGKNPEINVDTGFIVYNELNYPNLTAFFKHLDIKTEPSNMSFSASMDNGEFEYSGSGIRGLLAQKKNILNPRFWKMVYGIIRFYKSCPKEMDNKEIGSISLGEYLKANKYNKSFIKDHIYPVAGSIWSATNSEIEKFPIKSFINFFYNHGLLELNIKKRPKWRTVTNGSQAYVKKIIANFPGNLEIKNAVKTVIRNSNGIIINSENGKENKFDHAVIATHPNEALKILHKPNENEINILNKIRYENSHAFLHTDHRAMPKNKSAWSSWNYKSSKNKHFDNKVSLTYWMNKLQNIDYNYPLFVSLNPEEAPKNDSIIKEFNYDHPIFDFNAIKAQKELLSIQGKGGVWYCGAYFGYGFHEDGIQSGLYVAESLGGSKRPWTVKNESGRILK